MGLRDRPLAVIFLTVVVDLLGFGIIIPILPTYAERFGASALAVGLLGTSYSALQLLFAPVWGRISDRVGRRPVIVGTAAGAAISYVVFGLADSLWILFVARAIGGICAANISTAQAYIADVTTADARARGMAIVGAGFGLGFTFGPALAAGASYLGGVRAPFFVAAALAAANAVWAHLALRDVPRRETTAPRSRRAALASALRLPGMPFLLGIFALVTYAFSNVEATFALFTHAELGYDEGENGLAFTYIGLVLTVVQVGGTRRLTARFRERTLVAAGCTFLAIGAAAIPFATGAATLAIGLTFLAAGNAVNSPSLMAAISKAAPPDRQGEILGVAQSVGAIGRITGPAAGGWLFDHVGRGAPYASAAVLLGGCALAVALSARRASRTRTPMAR